MKIGRLNITEYLIVLFMSLSFFVGWYIGFQNPVFFNAKREMDQRAAVSSVSPIGIDLSEMVAISRTLYHKHSPYSYGTYIYPPLVSVLYLPFLIIRPENAYVFMSFLTITCLFLSFIMVDKLFTEKKFIPIVLLFFIITSFLSYGMHFELERGQFNIITIFLALLGVFLHQKNKRLLGILLVTISVHLKLYPIIFFFLLFLDNCRSKKGIFINFIAVLIHILLFFMLGKGVAGDFFSMLTEQLRNPFVWAGNHSLFAYCSDKSGTMPCNVYTYPYFLAAYIITIAAGFISTYVKKISLLNPYLFAMCGIATCVIPSVSHDYKLSIIPIFLFPLFKELYCTTLEKKSFANLITLSIGTVLYTLLLFSTNFGNTVFTMNKAPILVSLTVIAFIGMLINFFIIPNSTTKKVQGYLKKLNKYTKIVVSYIS